MVEAIETKVDDLTGMILEKKFDLVEQVLNFNLSVEQANTKEIYNQMSPIDAVYLSMSEEHFKVVDGKSDLLTLKKLFLIARLLLEKGAKIKETCEAMLYLAIRYKEETLRWLLKASLFSREFLEADLKVHMNEANEISNVLQVKTKLEKLNC